MAEPIQIKKLDPESSRIMRDLPSEFNKKLDKPANGTAVNLISGAGGVVYTTESAISGSATPFSSSGAAFLTGLINSKMSRPTGGTTQVLNGVGNPINTTAEAIQNDPRPLTSGGGYNVLTASKTYTNEVSAKLIQATDEIDAIAKTTGTTNVLAWWV